MTLEVTRVVTSLEDLPNTFDRRLKRYTWRHAGLLAYALVPRAFEGTTGSVDCYLCAEEDDLDDIDLQEYTGDVLKKTILKRWATVKNVHLLPPSLAAPGDLPCWKLRHESLEEAL